MTILELKENARRELSERLEKKKEILEALIVDNLKRGLDKTRLISEWFSDPETPKDKKVWTNYGDSCITDRSFTDEEIEQIAKDLEISFTVEIDKTRHIIDYKRKFLIFDEPEYAYRYRKVVTLLHGAL